MTTIAFPVNQLVISENIESLEPVDYTTLSDEVLVKLVGQKEDVDAFEQLYLRHHKRVYGLCLCMLKDPTDAEDLSQEVFIQAHRKLKSFRGDSAFTTWLHRVTINQVLMHFRKRFVKQEKLEEELTYAEKIQMQVHHSTRNLVEDHLLLHGAIKQLPDGYRNTFILHDIFGFEHTEVAGLMKVCEGTSKSQLHKARLRLRKLIKSKANPKIHHTRTDP